MYITFRLLTPVMWSLEEMLGFVGGCLVVELVISMSLILSFIVGAVSSLGLF